MVKKNNSKQNEEIVSEEGEERKIESTKENGDITEEPPKDTYSEGAQMYKIKAKSQTGLNVYYRNGLKFAPVFQDYEVSREVYESLKKDCHLTVEDI